MNIHNEGRPPRWLTKLASGLIVLGLTFLLLLTYRSCRAAELGASLSGNYYTRSDAPAGWFVVRGKSMSYKADATIYITEDNWKFALQTLVAGDGSPTFAGLNAGIGRSFGPFTAGLFHSSCHNLDNRVFIAQGPDPLYHSPPPCQYDGLKIRLDLGSTFEPLW